MLERYLAPTPVIDWRHPSILDLSARLSTTVDTPVELTQASFEWVRDTVAHSSDDKSHLVTCTASDVLAARTGFCFAKSHLLVALLRANGIPAGLCYQRLRNDEDEHRYLLHGLSAAYLPEIGWYRMDARGNKPGIDAQFTPPVERLAYPANLPGEATLPEVWPEPLPLVVDALRASGTAQQFLANLPDVELIAGAGTAL